MDTLTHVSEDKAERDSIPEKCTETFPLSSLLLRPHFLIGPGISVSSVLALKIACMEVVFIFGGTGRWQEPNKITFFLGGGLFSCLIVCHCPQPLSNVLLSVLKFGRGSEDTHTFLVLK